MRNFSLTAGSIKKLESLLSAPLIWPQVSSKVAAGGLPRAHSGCSVSMHLRLSYSRSSSPLWLMQRHACSGGCLTSYCCRPGSPMYLCVIRIFASAHPRL